MLIPSHIVEDSFALDAKVKRGRDQCCISVRQPAVPGEDLKG